MPPVRRKSSKKTPAPAPYDLQQKKKAEEAKKKALPEKNPLFERRPKTFGIGQDLPPKRDLRHFVRWPKYVRLQRQKRVLEDRLRIPPAVHQFHNTLDKNTALQLFKLLNKYRPETKQAKKQRQFQQAQAKVKGEEVTTTKPVVVKYGLNHVTALIEQKKAKLVIIAHDVDPLEIVVWLPALCKKMGVPYCIVKSKSRLGTVVHKKNAAVLALTEVSKEDMHEFGQLVTAIKENFNDRFDKINKTWGGAKLGLKSRVARAKIEKAKTNELKRAGVV